VIAAGADGIAVISALSITPDPEDAAKRLRAIVDDGLRVRGAA
jgi:thiamine-phosphate pyrophosphorylase